jgi:HKD family nuclease
LKYEKALDLIKTLSEGSKSAIVSSFLLNANTLRDVLGKNFPYSSLIIMAGQKSLELEGLKSRRLIDHSSIPLMGRVFHSKIYLFEKSSGLINLVIGSFNATSSGMSQNLEFWSKSQAKINLEGYAAQNIVDLILSKRASVDAISWGDFCLEEEKQFVVSPTIDVLWRLVRNSSSLAPGESRCLSDIVLKKGKFRNYDSILVHTLGNNSLSKALSLMIKDAVNGDSHVVIRVISPYHNIQGIKYLHKICLDAIKKSSTKVEIELLTVFPPDFSDKFSDPKKQPFASLNEIEKMDLTDERITVKLKIWKSETKVDLSELSEQLTSYAQNIFLHGKAIFVKSEDFCSFLLGSPNLTDAAFGSGPNVNFEVAVWVRNKESATKAWANFDPIFQACREADENDFKAFESWKIQFKKDQERLDIDVIGSQDAIRRFLSVSLKKNEFYQPLEPNEDTCVYFDELSLTSLRLELKTGCPKIDQNVRVSFTPSSLESTQITNLEFKKGLLCSPLLVDGTRPDSYFLRIDIQSNLIEERRIKVKIRERTIDALTVNMLLFDQDSVESFLIVETLNGPVELKCLVSEENLRVNKPKGFISNDHAFLRIYSKIEKTNNAFGYYIVRCRKREPRAIVRMSAIRPYPFSVYFEEITNALAARILPNSISISFLTSDSVEVPVSVVSIKIISTFPCIRNVLLLPSSFDYDEVSLVVSYTDEHSGSYRENIQQSIGFINENGRQLMVFVPKDMAKKFLFGTFDQMENIAPEETSNDYYRLQLPKLPNFSECDRDSISFFCDPLLDFYKVLSSADLELFPKPKLMVTSAQITIRRSLTGLRDNIKSRCSRTFLSWSLRSFGQEEKGKNKEQPINSVTEFQLTPLDLSGLYQKMNYSTSEWTGFLDFYFWHVFAGQYFLRSEKENVFLQSSQAFLNNIYNTLWKTIQSKVSLFSELCRLFHSFVDLSAPYLIFAKTVYGEEVALFQLREVYDFSPVISGDGFVEFRIKNKSRDALLNAACQIIMDRLYCEFRTDTEFPKIPKEIISNYLQNKITLLLEALLIIHGKDDQIRISPGRLFNAVDHNWINILKRGLIPN